MVPMIVGALGVGFGYGEFRQLNDGEIVGNIFVTLVSIGWPLMMVGGIMLFFGAIWAEILIHYKKSAQQDAERDAASRRPLA